MAVAQHRSRRLELGRWPALALWIAVAECAGLIGVPYTTAGAWYDGLDKAPFNPPSAVFGPVWVALYAVIGVAAWIAWSAPPSPARTRALGLWSVQLVVNAAWTPVFFGGRAPGWGLLVIAALVLLAAATAVALARVDRRAGWLFVPYLAWVSFATVLNAWIVVAS